MSENNFESILNALIDAHNADDGVGELVFNATFQLIRIVRDERMAQIFSNHIDATDGRFYFAEGRHMNFLNAPYRDSTVGSCL